jgi:hypothetical protein
MTDIQQLLTGIKKELENLRFRRVFQQDLMPQAVKQKHMGEPNAYINAGLEADIPDGASVTSGVSVYFEKDTNKLKIYNGTSYVSVTLS